MTELSSFQKKVLGWIHMSYLLGEPFNPKGHGWCTCRGNSTDATTELLAKGLVEKYSCDGYYRPTVAGKAMIPNLFLSKAELKIQVLEKEKYNPKTSSHRRQEIILEIHNLRNSIR